MSKNADVYQLKISLNNIKPPIWRRILIPANSNFWALHVAIQDAFGWIGYHLHQFIIGPIRDRNVTIISMPNPEYDPSVRENELDEVQTKIYQHISEEQKTAKYIYDFGDDWVHQIKLEKIIPFDDSAHYPQLVKGKRACPPEDSGGPYNYQQNIEILKDKDHEYHQETLERFGVDSYDELDLESFDPEAVVFNDPEEELNIYQDLFGQD